MHQHTTHKQIFTYSHFLIKTLNRIFIQKHTKDHCKHISNWVKMGGEIIYICK
jgi:hypothetical protein